MTINDFRCKHLQVPICSSTGGLVDTVKEGVTGFHMGSFNVEVKNSRQPFSYCSQTKEIVIHCGLCFSCSVKLWILLMSQQLLQMSNEL